MRKSRGCHKIGCVQDWSAALHRNVALVLGPKAVDIMSDVLVAIQTAEVTKSQHPTVSEVGPE